MKDTLNHCSTKQKELFSGVHSHTQKRFPFKKQSVNIKTGSVTRQYPVLNINTVFVDFPCRFSAEAISGAKHKHCHC